VTFRTRGSRPSKDYLSEIEDVRAAREALRTAGFERIALVGRSFGGRICAFLAELEPPDALVILGHPIAPPKRPRPRDESALAGTRCPTLVVQGEEDELGPFAVLERIAANNPRIDLVRIAGAGHDFGAREPEAVAAAARWLDSVLR
jgi:predicted alpha/beta-hydrolase family hydrolase